MLDHIRPHKHARQGFALVASLLVLAAMLVLVTAMIALRSAELGAVSATMSTSRAQLAADSGVEAVRGIVVASGTIPATSVSGTVAAGNYSASASVVGSDVRVVSRGSSDSKSRVIEALLDVVERNRILEEYAILACHDLEVGGSADVLNGDIYSGADLLLTKRNVLVNGDARAFGSITLGGEGAVTGNVISKTGDITGGPGTRNKQLVGGYAANPVSRSTLTDRQVGAGILHDEDILEIPDYCQDPFYTDTLFVTEDEFQAYKTAVEGTPAYLIGDQTSSSLPTPLVKGGTYFIEGNLTLNANLDATATIVVSGDLTITGNVTIGSEDGGAALIVDGDVQQANGNATVNGVLYTNGSVSMGNGNFDVNGSVVMADREGSSDFSGNLNVTYVRPDDSLNLPKVVVIGTQITQWRLLSDN